VARRLGIERDASIDVLYLLLELVAIDEAGGVRLGELGGR
jgi:hypothetical protein